MDDLGIRNFCFLYSTSWVKNYLIWRAVIIFHISWHYDINNFLQIGALINRGNSSGHIETTRVSVLSAPTQKLGQPQNSRGTAAEQPRNSPVTLFWAISLLFWEFGVHGTMNGAREMHGKHEAISIRGCQTGNQGGGGKTGNQGVNRVKHETRSSDRNI